MGDNCGKTIYTQFDSWKANQVPNLCSYCWHDFYLALDNLELIHPKLKRADIEKIEYGRIGERYKKNLDEWMAKTENEIDR